jgi:hypothetical protein
MKDDISIDIYQKEHGYQNSNIIFEKHYFNENYSHRSGSPMLPDAGEAGRRWENRSIEKVEVERSIGQ